MSLSILILIFLFIFTMILACLEMALSSANRIKIKSKAEQKDKKAMKIMDFIDNYEETITTIIVLNNIINIILPTVSTIIFIKLMPQNQQLAVLLSSIFMTIILLVFGEIIPKTYGKKNSGKVLFFFTGFIGLIIKIFKPITFIFIKINNLVSNKLFKNNQEDATEVEDELLTMIKESSQEGYLEENESELLRNVIEFNDIRVDEILQPKNNVVMVDINDAPEEIYKVLKRERYSRVPVFEGTTDNIIGLLSEKEFLIEYIQNKNFQITKILREIDFIPDTLKISRLLPEMQQKHNHMAIVVDEYGTVQGIITVEDILEELVGEIWDEHDEVITEYEKINDSCFIVRGNMTIGDFNLLFEKDNIDTETEDSTIAGYILEKAERIPDEGEIIQDLHFSFKILDLNGKQLERIQVTAKNDFSKEENDK